MKPTREQVIQWAAEANILQSIDLLESNQWRQDLIRELELFAGNAYAAGIEKGLDMATDVCKRRRDYEMTQDRMSASMCASDCAKAIEQLKSKQ